MAHGHGLMVQPLHVHNANLDRTLCLEVPVALSVLPDLSRHQQGPRQAQCVLPVLLDRSLVLLALPHAKPALLVPMQVLDHPFAHVALLESQQHRLSVLLNFQVKSIFLSLVRLSRTQSHLFLPQQ